MQISQATDSNAIHTAEGNDLYTGSPLNLKLTVNWRSTAVGSLEYDKAPEQRPRMGSRIDEHDAPPCLM